jgi:hypothetical protein
MKDGIYNLDNYAVLDSVFEIEELLEAISVLQGKIEHYQELKKYRVSTCENKIESFKSKIDLYRSVILNTMQKFAPDKKTIDFSPVGKVTRKKPSKLWEVNDEEKLLKFLATLGKKEEVVETKEKIIKKKLDGVLDDLLSSKKKIPGVSLVESDESISIVFEKTYVPKEKSESQEVENDVIEMDEKIEI